MNMIRSQSFSHPRRCRASWLRRAALAFAAELALPVQGVAQVPAHPTLDLHWNRPDGHYKRNFEGPGPVDIYVTLRGLREPITAHQIWLTVTWDYWGHTGDKPLPDAWRFDPDGCQAGRACMQTGQLSPYLSGPPTSEARELGLVEYDEGTHRLRVGMAEIYGRTAVLDPESTYTVLRLRFDHSFSVAGDSATSAGSCTGAGEWLHIGFNSARRSSYIDVNGVEHPFDMGQEFLYWNAPPWLGARTPPSDELAAEGLPDLFSGRSGSLLALPRCDVPVPAHATTWGRLKSNYR